MTDPTAILQALVAGRTSPAEAAKALLALEGPASAGLAIDPSGLAPAEFDRLKTLMAAVSWETAKLVAAKPMPDVPYDSPEYHAFMASVPRARSDPAGPAA